jgi:hypothetical protein
VSRFKVSMKKKEKRKRRKEVMGVIKAGRLGIIGT